MKKVTLLGVVIIMLAVSVVPVLAANGGSNGHGNGQGHGHDAGMGAGQANPGGDQDQTRDQDRVRQHISDGSARRGAHGNLLKMRMRTPFYLQGIVKTVGTNTVTVDVIHANSQLKLYIGTSFTFQTDVSTRIYKPTQGSDENGEGDGNKVIITLSQLPGRKVAVHGNLVNGVYLARLITEYIQLQLGEIGGNP